MSYFSIHNHSEYSNGALSDSTNQLKDLLRTAAELGLSGIALTDHECLSGHMKALSIEKKLKEEFPDFKVGLGNEIYITRENLTAENHEKGEKFFHCILLAKDDIGHKQIRTLSDRANRRAYVRNILRRPTYLSDILDVIGEDPDHIIMTTACLGGITGREFSDFQSIRTDGVGYNALEFMMVMKNLLGDDFFIELQPSKQQDQIKYNRYMMDNFSKDYPFVYSTDSHYLRPEDRAAHRALLNAKEGDREVDAFYSSTYLMTEEEVWEYMVDYTGEDFFRSMTENSLRIQSELQDINLTNPTQIPKVEQDIDAADLYIKEILAGRHPLLMNETEIDKIKFPYIYKYIYAKEIPDRCYVSQVLKGLEKLIEEPSLKYYERLETELEQIWEISVTIKNPMSNYFLTQQKINNIIWEDADSLVGVSRGSAASYLSNYCLEITQIDPLEFPVELPFWRFMHKDRPDFPDIDIDTEGNKRLQVISEVRNYFQSTGGDLIQVATFGTLKSKSSLKTAARGTGRLESDVAYACSLIPNERGKDWELSQCYAELPAFKEEMNKLGEVWSIASRLENLIVSVGIHASGVVAINRELTHFCSAMRNSKGTLISSYDLHDCEAAGMIKYDFLTINALDKIRTTMNFLLEEEKMEWQGSLKDTYYHYLEPSKLNYTEPKMWDMVQNGKIMSLFQFDTPAGGQGIVKLQPKNFIELAATNSLIRLQATDDGVLPLEKYRDYKNDIQQWYMDISKYRLNQEEVNVLEELLLKYNGIADTQEQVMRMVMHPKIGNGGIILANKLRKGLAHKQPEIIEEAKKLFFESGIENGTRMEMLNYIWNEQIRLSLGYSFSIVHVAGYTTIAIQEMNLAYYYPIIYWNTANLCSDSDAFNSEDFPNLQKRGIMKGVKEENKKGVSKRQYGKIAAAVSNMQNNNVTIKLPDINRARYGFVPDCESNSILYGFQAISGIGEAVIDNIIDKRPFVSVEDFVQKMKDGNKTLISKNKVINLIKAGSFDEVESDSTREDVLFKYIYSVSDIKKTLNLRNMQMLIQEGLINKDNFKEVVEAFKFTKYIKSLPGSTATTYKLDDITKDYLEEHGYGELIDNNATLPVNEWTRVYNGFKAPVRTWIAENLEELLKKVNEKAFADQKEKYASGNKLSWELDSLNFYHSGHELSEIELPIDIADINDLKENDLDTPFYIKGKVIPKYFLKHIVGTVLDKDKSKHLVYFSTPNGVIKVKLFRTSFAKYDKTIARVIDGKKTIIDESWFKKGTKLLITGIKRGDDFVPKVYKSTRVNEIVKLNSIGDNEWTFTREKMKE